MKSYRFFLTTIFSVSSVGINGCFPNFEATVVKPAEIKTITRIVSPTKAYLLDASVVIFPNGFTVINNDIAGISQRHWIDRTDLTYRERFFTLDSIVAMTHYDSKISVGRGIASFLLGVTGTVMAPLSIYCISCPKCCFGSCPTVYINEKKNATLQAELFSHSISSLLEDQDLDLLNYHARNDTSIKLIITNEALETHYINKLSLLRVQHPIGTRVFPSVSNDFIIFKNIIPPLSALSRNGKDVLDRIKAPDSLGFRTEMAQFPFLAVRGETDWIDFQVAVPATVRKVKMLVRLRNTLLSTTLFYDVVLGSQGINALDWNNRMNTDTSYAAQFKQTYDAFSGVTVSIDRNGAWKRLATIQDVGPIMWKYVATEIPVEEFGTMHIRLSMFPDNAVIDYVGFSTDVEDSASVSVETLFPKQIIDHTGSERIDVISSIISNDDKYLVTDPGDSYELLYGFHLENNTEHTFFISSQGFYTEWIRGSWLTTTKAVYRFELSNTPEVLSQLVTSWLQNKDEIEHKFFESKIPTRRLK